MSNRSLVQRGLLKEEGIGVLTVETLVAVLGGLEVFEGCDRLPAFGQHVRRAVHHDYFTRKHRVPVKTLIGVFRPGKTFSGDACLLHDSGEALAERLLVELGIC